MANFFEEADISASKKRILNSALVLFVEKGFFNTSIPDLVAHSGVSTGSIYHAFKDKEQLATTLMDLLLDKVEADQAGLLSTHSGCWQRYYHLAKWLFEMTEDFPHVMQFILYARHREFMPTIQPLCSSKPFMTLRSVLEQGQQAGELRTMDLMVASSIAYGSILRLIQLHLDGVAPEPLKEHLDELTSAAWRAIK
ncbi:TetR/AcrR family transcriptional regulator [Hydrogenovibrio sp. 3SP14C1]|uniref:TetR/AcrR family transcriptional regulator n=1 Tax=Hydrogenovibrio sp. 3SP14C1 TaxID=3038774 RepID=UPI002417F698|nr:TetR/AcrR family transcriptional regulator [Hydrogenovibrio sp. 3SP14C1]MDG4812268.1 TetR/AcrR family transcriptional regulator [Hydrogenovibrio sp. 3SP14C1]